MDTAGTTAVQVRKPSSGAGTDDFTAAQLALLRTYRQGVRAGRVALGRVIVPYDSADATTRKRYRAHAESRHDVRTHIAPKLGWHPAERR